MKHERRNLVGFIDMFGVFSEENTARQSALPAYGRQEIINCQGFAEDILDYGFELVCDELKAFIERYGHNAKIRVEPGWGESEVLMTMGGTDGPHLIEIGYDDVRDLIESTGCKARAASINIIADQVAEFLTRLVVMAEWYKVFVPEQSIEPDVLKDRYCQAICEEYDVPRLIGSPYIG